MGYRNAGWVLGLALVAATATAASAATRVDFRVSSGTPLVTYQDEPRPVVVPGTRVSWWENEDYDLYRYGNQYYVVRDGRWYSSGDMRGRYRPISEEYVPQQVYLALNYRTRNGNQWAHSRWLRDRVRYDNPNWRNERRYRDWDRHRDWIRYRDRYSDRDDQYWDRNRRDR